MLRTDSRRQAGLHDGPVDGRQIILFAPDDVRQVLARLQLLADQVSLRGQPPGQVTRKLDEASV